MWVGDFDSLGGWSRNWAGWGCGRRHVNDWFGFFSLSVIDAGHNLDMPQSRYLKRLYALTFLCTHMDFATLHVTRLPDEPAAYLRCLSRSFLPLLWSDVVLYHVLASFIPSSSLNCQKQLYRRWKALEPKDTMKGMDMLRVLSCQSTDIYMQSSSSRSMCCEKLKPPSNLRNMLGCAVFSGNWMSLVLAATASLSSIFSTSPYPSQASTTSNECEMRT